MGITLGSNFTVNTGLPLDDRAQVANLTARDAIPSGRRWQGMNVFVVAEGKTFQLKTGIANTDWVEAGSGGGSGVPAGGTTGQTLKKNSNTDGDASWATLGKADVGLGNVDNTSDANKPVSTATQSALNAKADSSAMTTALNAKANTSDVHNVPAGGAVGQILQKNSATDYDAGWAAYAPGRLNYMTSAVPIVNPGSNITVTRTGSNFNVIKSSSAIVGDLSYFGPIPVDAADQVAGQKDELSFRFTPVTGNIVLGEMTAEIRTNDGLTPLGSVVLVPGQRYYTVTWTQPATAQANVRLYLVKVGTGSTAFNMAIDQLLVGPYLNSFANAFVTTPDSLLRINGWGSGTGGAGAANVKSFTTATFQESFGSHFTYLDDTTLGARIVVNQDCFASFEVAMDGTGTGDQMALSKNSQNLSTAPNSLPQNEKLAPGYGDVMTLSWSGPLKQNDIIRLHVSTGSVVSSSYSSFSASAVGLAKAVTSVTDQKITIPTSELRFEGTSSRGSVATQIIKFDALASIRGDAFTIVNTTADGTYVQFKKAGVLDTSVSIAFGANIVMNLSRNQSVLTTFPTQQETLGTNVGNSSSTSWHGRVAVNDIIRVSTDNNPSNSVAYAKSVWTMLFWEDQINVAVNTVLPIWSQSDSASRVTGSAANGTTNTEVARFANVSTNLGSAITYVPSATLGDSWILNEDGVYGMFMNYRNSSNTSAFIVKGITTLAARNAENQLAQSEVDPYHFRSNASFGGFLPAGTVIRVLNGGVTNPSDEVAFSIFKVGKPNLTAADVTSFVQYKNKDWDQYLAAAAGNTYGTTNTGVGYYGTVYQNSSKGIISVISNTAEGTYVKVLKDCYLTMGASASTTGSGGHVLSAVKNPTGAVTQGQYAGANLLIQNTVLNNYQAMSSWSGRATAGETYYFVRVSTGVLTTTDRFFAYAEGDLDAIVATSKAVSSDSWTWAFKSTAIDSAVDPVGTFNTYTYAASGNVATLATTAPTQVASSMQANGIQMFARAYNAASTAASPSRADIYIGKKLGATSVTAYAAVLKASAIVLDLYTPSNTQEAGTNYVYEESTGIMTITTGLNWNSTTTTKYVGQNPKDATAPTNAYFTINAAPTAAALTSVPAMVKKIAVMTDQKASGTASQAATTTYSARQLNTLQDPSGIVKNPGVFGGVGGTNTTILLGPGSYYFDGEVQQSSNGTPQDTRFKGRIQNITDGVTAVLGKSMMSQAASGDASIDVCRVLGIVVVTKDTAFELQQRSNTTASPWGIPSSFGDNEVYSSLTIEKLN